MPTVLNPVSRSRRNVKHHYDLSDELFSLFLIRTGSILRLLPLQ